MFIFFFTISVFLNDCFLNDCQAIAPDGIHTRDDYVQLSFESPVFDAACAVVDSSGGSMTGVLVAPDIVVTAAHGIELIFNQSKSLQTTNDITIIPLTSLNVYFAGKSQTQAVNVTHVLIDPRYFQSGSREGKFDFAFLKLANRVNRIEPAELFDKEILPNNALMTVVTYGMSDLQSMMPSFFGSRPVRRAFRLYERDTYFGRAEDPEVLKSSRYLQESSVFFKPLEQHARPTQADSEEIVRSYEATQNWIADGKKPYGLALPGTSGAPVFIRLTKDGKPKDYLYGLVSSYAHLSGQFHTRGNYEMNHILTHLKQSQGEYQTIFSLFYRNKTNQTVPNHHAMYAKDPIFDLLLRKVKSFFAFPVNNDHVAESNESNGLWSKLKESTGLKEIKGLLSKLIKFNNPLS